jgi:hypothetical protein
MVTVSEAVPSLRLPTASAKAPAAIETDPEPSKP